MADGDPTVPGARPDDLVAAVESAVQEALRTGSEDHLRVLGHGEISLVVGWPTDEPVVACKRLPVFPSTTDAERYADVFSRYIARLEQGGLHVVPSRLVFLDPGPDGRQVGYVVQPVLPSATLGPDILRAAEPDPEHPLLTAVVAAVLGAVDERTGLDAQISNWAVSDGALQYLDVTTPILYGDGGLELDVDMLIASYPWLLRPPLRRFAAPPIAAAYCDPRTVLLDLAANLHKERLAAWIPAVLEVADRELPVSSTGPTTGPSRHGPSTTPADHPRRGRQVLPIQRAALGGHAASPSGRPVVAAQDPAPRLSVPPARPDSPLTPEPGVRAELRSGPPAGRSRRQTSASTSSAPINRATFSSIGLAPCVVTRAPCRPTSSAKRTSSRSPPTSQKARCCISRCTCCTPRRSTCESDASRHGRLVRSSSPRIPSQSASSRRTVTTSSAGSGLSPVRAGE